MEGLTPQARNKNYAICKKTENTVNSHLFFAGPTTLSKLTTWYASRKMLSLITEKKNTGKPDTLALNIRQENRKTQSHESINTLLFIFWFALSVYPRTHYGVSQLDLISH